MLKLKNLFKTPKYKYEIYWGCCDGRHGHYISNSLSDIRAKINKDNSLNEEEKNILKYGYFNEFKKDIKTDNFCIDNGFDIHWFKYKLVY